MKSYLKKMKNELIQGKAKLFDVREQEEWNKIHLKSSVLVPMSTINRGRIPIKNIKKTIYLHCHSGKRAHSAKPILMALGFRKVIVLKESFEELSSLNL